MNWIKASETKPKLISRKECVEELGCYSEYSDFVLVNVAEKYYVMRYIVDYDSSGNMEQSRWVDADYLLYMSTENSVNRSLKTRSL